MQTSFESGQQQTALIIAGAFETRERAIEPLEWMLNPLGASAENFSGNNTSSRYRALGAKVLSGPLRNGLVIPNMGTPRGMGPQNVRRSFDEIYDEAEAEIDAKLARDGNILFGHSLGAVIASIYAHKKPWKVEAVVAIGPPYEGIVTEWDDKLTHLNQALRTKTDWVRARRASLGNQAPELHSIASIRDTIVPMESAHTDIPGMKKHLLNSAGSPVHEEMMNHPAVITFCGTILDEVAWVRAEAARVPQPMPA